LTGSPALTERRQLFRGSLNTIQLLQMTITRINHRSSREPFQLILLTVSTRQDSIQKRGVEDSFKQLPGLV